MKTRTPAVILAFFLGGFGAHRFYLGQTKLGITYLLFCWTLIPTCISFFDCLVLLFTPKQKFDKKYNNNSSYKEECVGCKSQLGFFNTPNFGGGKLNDGNRVCMNCFGKIIKIEPGFGISSKKKYDSERVLSILDSRPSRSQAEKNSDHSKSLSNKPVSVNSLVESVQSVSDLKALKKEAERFDKLFEKSDYTNTRYEKMTEIYEEAYYKGQEKVFYYQFVPNINLDSPQEIVDQAFKVFPAKDYTRMRKKIGGADYDWQKIYGHDLTEESLKEIKEKRPFYWDTYLKFRDIINANTSFEEKANEINLLTKEDRSFEDEFFYRDSTEKPGDQWLKEILKSYNIPLVDRLFSLGYNTPEKVAEINLEEIKSINGFGPQKIEQLSLAIDKIKGEIVSQNI